jgi:RHS repeat-associated protein
MTVTYSNFCGMVVGETRDGVEYEYIPDTMGSTIGIRDSDGNVTDTWEYWPYGEVAHRTGSHPTELTFLGTLGYVQDALDRLFYVRARHLRADLARWLTVDPLWPEEPAYGYVRGKPVDWVDPSGLGDVITNKQCKSGCDQLFRKSSERNACYYICEHRSGSNRDCSALRRYCEHLCNGHSVDKKEYCGPCEQLLGALCPPPGRQVPEPLPGRQRAPQEFTVPKRSDWSQRDLEGCFACRWSLMPIAGRMVEVCARLGGPILIRF